MKETDNQRRRSRPNALTFSFPVPTVWWLAYFAVMLVSGASAHADGYRPDFDCSKPPAKNGVATMLCQDSNAAKHELEFDQAYYALRQVVGPGGWKALRQQIILQENALNQSCGLPNPGADDQTVPPGGSACYVAGMDKLTADLKQRLAGAALEEANRDLNTHITLQRRLRDLGYLPPDTTTDGVYGEATRGAIRTWQQAAGRPQATSFMSNDDAFMLSNSSIRAPAPVLTATGQNADNVLLHTVRTVYACANPRATRALANATDPRQSDPKWLAYVRTDGRCFETPPDQGWERISAQDGLLLLRRTPPVVGEPPLFFRPEDIAEPATVPAVVPATVTLPPEEPSQQAPVTATVPDPAAVPENLPAVSDPPPVTTPVMQPDSSSSGTELATGRGSGGGVLWLLVMIVAAAFTAVVIAGKRAKRRELEAQQRERDRRREQALGIAVAEIDTQQRPLHVRWLQLVTADIYGTVDLTKWASEKERFVRTRIMPLLAGQGLSDQWELINYVVDSRIDLVAEASLAGDPEYFSSDPQTFDPRMTPQDYELHCALLLRSAGWDAQTTVASGDQGTDVLAKRDGKVLVVQCKLYSQPVGNFAVQEVSAARLHQRADYAAVVSNAVFTSAARQLARTNGVYLLHHEELPVFDPASAAM